MSGEQLKKAGHLFIEKKRNSAWKKLGKKKKGKKEKFSAEGENTRSSLAHLLSCIITYVHTCAISELQCRGQHYSVPMKKEAVVLETLTPCCQGYLRLPLELSLISCLMCTVALHTESWTV